LTLLVLALRHDSSRIITVHAGFMGTQPLFNGTTIDYHNLSHHGRLPENLEKLSLLEDESMKTFAHLMKSLTETQEEASRCSSAPWSFSAAIWGTPTRTRPRTCPCSWRAAVSNTGQHLVFNRENNTPLCNLYVSMLQRLGLEIPSFGSSKSTLTGSM
jgi:hypothetical protein